MLVGCNGVLSAGPVSHTKFYCTVAVEVGQGRWRTLSAPSLRLCRLQVGATATLVGKNAVKLYKLHLRLFSDFKANLLVYQQLTFT